MSINSFNTINASSTGSIPAREVEVGMFTLDGFIGKISTQANGKKIILEHRNVDIIVEADEMVQILGVADQIVKRRLVRALVADGKLSVTGGL